jgi:hypothetical protein
VWYAWFDVVAGQAHVSYDIVHNVMGIIWPKGRIQQVFDHASLSPVPVEDCSRSRNRRP